MAGEAEVTEELARWGFNFTTTNGTNIWTADPNSCNQLKELLITNYPCMKDGICTPLGSPTSFIFIMIALFLVAIFVGYKLHEWEQKKLREKP